MTQRITLGVFLTLTLVLAPGLAFGVSANGVKELSPEQTPDKLVKIVRSGKAKIYDLSGEDWRDLSPRGRAPKGGISETKPLMRVIPQRDGRFLLEPQTCAISGSPLSRASRTAGPQKPSDLREPRVNRSTPWSFSELILTKARCYQNTPYHRGGSLRYGHSTDCSGFVQYIYQGFKIDLPRSSSEQAQVGQVVARTMDYSRLLPGDLLFFSRGGQRVGHAGIYMGEGKMIHASGHGVVIADLHQPYFAGTFMMARRVFEVDYPE